MPAHTEFVMQGPDHSSLLIFLITSNEGIRYKGLEAEKILYLHRGKERPKCIYAVENSLFCIEAVQSRLLTTIESANWLKMQFKCHYYIPLFSVEFILVNI